MGYFRFRRSIKLAPGVRWNIGKKGSSVSIGGHGLTHTISAKGSRTTVGIPGSGVSYTHIHRQPSSTPPGNRSPGPTPATSTRSSFAQLFYVLGIIVLILWLLYKASSNSTVQFKPSASAPTALPTVNPHLGGESQPNPISTAVVVSTPSAESTPIAELPPSSGSTPIPAMSAIPVPVMSASPVSTTIPVPIDYRVVNVQPTDFLVVRSNPGAGYSVIVNLRPNARGIALGPRRVANGTTMWQEISVGGYHGWVNEAYLARDTSP